MQQRTIDSCVNTSLLYSILFVYHIIYVYIFFWNIKNHISGKSYNKKRKEIGQNFPKKIQLLLLMKFISYNYNN